MKTFKNVLGSIAITIAIGLCWLATATAEQTNIKLDIDSQPLNTALNAFATQSGLQVVFSAEVGKGLISVSLKGSYTPEAAMKELLANTPFEYRFLNERTVEVRVRPKVGAWNTPADQMRVATMEEGSSKSNSTSSSKSLDDSRNQVTVEGQREKPKAFSTANLDLTRTEDDVLPFTIFDAKDIQLSGASNLQEFLQSRLVQNFNADIPEELGGAGVGGVGIGGAFGNDGVSRTSRVDFRGWGANETVFLLNGRRMSPQYQGINIDSINATPNLQGIPLPSIDRIEILSSAGSAIYGESATGGIVNIVTKQDSKGGQLGISYETPSDVHAPRRGVDINFSFPLKLGMSLRVSASYNEYEPLEAGDRADVTIDRWRRLVLERQPTRLIRRVANDPFRTNSIPVMGATPNIRAITTGVAGVPGNLFFDLPGSQASNFTTVPDGYSGAGGLSAFEPGTWNLDQADGAAGSSLWARGSTLGTRNENTTIATGIDKNFGERWRLSLDYRYSQNDNIGHPDTSFLFVFSPPRVPASAPSNPFGQDVWVSMVDRRMQRPELGNTPRNVTNEISATLRSNLGQWSGFLDFTYSQNHNRFTNELFYEPAGGWTSAFESGAYNPFVDPRTIAPAAPEFYESYIAARSLYISATRNYQSTVKASGPVLRLPDGDLQLTVGAEWSHSDRYKSSQFSQYQDGLTGQPRIPEGLASDVFGDDRAPYRRFAFDTYAGYVEVSAPVVSNRRGIPLVKQLELFGSGRISYQLRNGYRLTPSDPTNPFEPIYEEFEYKYKPSIYAIGLRHEIIKGLSIRASRSIGFKPPSIEQVSPGITLNTFPTDPVGGFTDPKRDDESGQITRATYMFGGNPDVVPETSSSTNIGMIYAPSFLHGFRLSVDYVESIRDNAITNLGDQETVILEDELPGRVVRGAPDGHPSGIGPIVFLDASTINLRQIASKSIDLSLQQLFSNVLGGRLVLNAAATKNVSFKVQATASSASVEQVRNSQASFSQALKWNANVQLQWEGQHWSLGWSTRYFDYVLVNPADLILQGDDRAPARLNHDFNLSYYTPAMRNPTGVQWLMSGTTLGLGIKNIFDRDPRFWAGSAERGVVSYDSIAGRTVWVQMRKSFE